MNGIILIDKPAGWTSFDVVAKIRGLVRKETGQKVRVGHAGTLDPFATGLLVVLLGSATKHQDMFMKQDKSYEATLKLGYASSTDDPEGSIEQKSTKRPNKEQILSTLASFTGQIEQVPPRYSAIKINGKRAYKLAREGKEVTLKSRAVTIHQLECVEYSYPDARIICRVSSGTYIRTLGRDIGEQLGTGAYLTELRRTTTGQHSVTHAVDPAELSVEKISAHILPL